MAQLRMKKSMSWRVRLDLPTSSDPSNYSAANGWARVFSHPPPAFGLDLDDNDCVSLSAHVYRIVNGGNG